MPIFTPPDNPTNVIDKRFTNNQATDGRSSVLKGNCIKNDKSAIIIIPFSIRDRPTARRNNYSSLATKTEYF